VKHGPKTTRPRWERRAKSRMRRKRCALSNIP
jgi:hypothetical protein